MVSFLLRSFLGRPLGRVLVTCRGFSKVVSALTSDFLRSVVWNVVWLFHDSSEAEVGCVNGNGSGSNDGIESGDCKNVLESAPRWSVGYMRAKAASI